MCFPFGTDGKENVPFEEILLLIPNLVQIIFTNGKGLPASVVTVPLPDIVRVCGSVVSRALK